MAVGYASMSSTVNIGSSVVSISITCYGGGISSASIVVDGTPVDLSSLWDTSSWDRYLYVGTKTFTAGGFPMRAVFEGTAGIHYSREGYGRFRLYYDQSTLQYSGSTWQPIDNTSFISIGSTSVSGSDEGTVSNTLFTALPVLQEYV
jgi:hypothetical protein